MYRYFPSWGIGGRLAPSRCSIRSTFLPAIALIIASLYQITSSRSWSLDELVAEALRTSKEVKQVQAEMNRVDAQIREAYGSALPEISASANYQYAWETFNPVAGSMDFSGMGALADPAVTAPLYGILGDPTRSVEDSILAASLLGLYMGMGALAGIDLSTPPNTIVLGLSVQQPIYAQGKVTIGLKVAKQFKDGLLCKYDAARQKAKADVTKSFYAALLAQAGVGIREEALAVANESHRLAVVKLALGRAGEIDTFSTRFEVENAQMELRGTQSMSRVVREALIKQAGIAEHVDTFAVGGEFPTGDFEISLEDAVAKMLANNKNIGQLNSGEKIQEQLVKLEKSNYRPMIYAGAKWNKFLMFDGVDDIDWGAEGSTDRAVFAGASYTLFNGLQRRQKVRQASENLSIFRLTREQALDGLEIGVRSAWEAIETSRVSLVSTGSMVSLARKGHDLAKKSYEVGMSTLADLQAVEAKLNGALLALNAARFAFHSAVLDLKLLMGDISVGN